MDVPRTKRRGRRLYAAVGVFAVAAVGVSALGFDRSDADVPTVARRSVRTAVVERGELERSVSGPGSLVPERIRWLTTTTAARVDRLVVEAGQPVDADTVVIELVNPDLELAALEAESELAGAKAELANLGASLETNKLGQQAALATVRSEQSEAARTAAANEKLAEADSVSADELARARDRAEELDARLSIEKKRLGVLDRARRAQVTAAAARVTRLEAVVEFRKRQLAALSVKAGEPGVVQEIPVEIGQWVQPGTVLAKVIDPKKLEAELKIPEVRARDLAIGLPAKIDMRSAVIEGKVSRIDPAVTAGSVTVDVALEGELPPGARADLSVDGTIEIETLADVTWLRRPAHAEPDSTLGLFVIGSDGIAERVTVQLGRASVDAIEVLSGVEVGDEVVVSDASAWDELERIRID